MHFKGTSKNKNPKDLKLWGNSICQAYYLEFTMHWYFEIKRSFDHRADVLLSTLKSLLVLKRSPSKVENISKGSLDSIPSPSVKIQLMGRNIFLRCKGKHCWKLSTKFWNKKVVNITQQCFFLITSSNLSNQ